MCSGLHVEMVVINSPLNSIILKLKLDRGYANRNASLFRRFGGGSGARVELFEQFTTRFGVTHHHKISWISYSAVNISDMAVGTGGGYHFIIATHGTKQRFQPMLMEMLNTTGCIKTSLLAAFPTNS